MRLIIFLLGSILLFACNEKKVKDNSLLVTTYTLNLESCSSNKDLHSLISLLNKTSLRLNEFLTEEEDRATTEEIIFTCFNVNAECGVELFYRLRDLKKTEIILYNNISEYYPLEYADDLANYFKDDSADRVNLKLQILKLMIIDYCNCN